MRLFRFDPEVSMPVEQFGSRLSISPLTGPDSRCRVQIMNLPADGLIGRHPATTAQLFAVVAGAGWASGADGVARPLRAGQAALWEPGEDHAAGSDNGLTALCIEGEFDLWALAITKDIVVSDYDPVWPRWFNELEQRIWPAVAAVARRIDHVGSTAVPGLAAKPVIDLDIVVASTGDVAAAIDALRTAGYRWRGDLGITGREAFALIDDDGRPPHHLYVVVDGNRAHCDHWLLRDLLRADPEARRRYGELKKANAANVDNDMDAYIAAKAALVAELLTRARAERGLPPVTYWHP